MHNKSNYPVGIGITSICKAILTELLLWETIESWISFLQYLLLSINWRGIHIPEITITSPCSHGVLWITRCLLEIEYSREKLSRRFLDSLKGNCQTQLVREPAKESDHWICCLWAERDRWVMWWSETVLGTAIRKSYSLMQKEGGQQNCALIFIG